MESRKGGPFCGKVVVVVGGGCPAALIHQALELEEGVGVWD